MLQACDENNLERPNIAVLIESGYESGSKDLSNNLDKASTYLNEVNTYILLCKIS